MIGCPECGGAMIRADLYDPEGTIPLYGGKVIDNKWWVCLNCSELSLGIPLFDDVGAKMLEGKKEIYRD